jgi:hypothetical protein
MTLLRSSLAATLLLVVACSRHESPASVAAPPATSNMAPASSPSLAATLSLGEPITSSLVSLSDLAHNPARYQGKVIATSGKVTSVCREMGCWMELQDASGQAHVRMHGHSFFVPKTSPGHLARVQATVVKPAGAADDCEEKPGSSVAKVELDATGVEID